MKSLIKKISNSFEGGQYDVATIGSYSKKDLDVVIIGNNNNSTLDKEVINFCETINCIENLNNNFILRNKDRWSSHLSGTYFHILYYPSYECLRCWELPSFIAYLHDRGNYIYGTREPLVEDYTQYRNNNITLVNSTRYHIIKYSENVIHNVIYSKMGMDVVPVKQAIEDLIYAFRFSLTEEMVFNTPSANPINFWDWNELLEFENSSPLNEDLFTAVFKNRGSLIKSNDRNLLIDLSVDYLHFISDFLITKQAEH